MEGSRFITAASGTQVDYLIPGANGGGHASGSVAQMLLNGGLNVNALRTYDTLRKDEWKAMDNTLIEVARQRLVGVQDLLTAGLTYNLTNPLGITRLEWETVSTMTPAEISMSGLSRAENDRVDFNLVGLPIPIVHKDFDINIRALIASRNRGEPLDVTQVALVGRLVAEKLESLVFSGGYSVGTNGTIYGYTNATNRNTGSVTASWATTTGENMLTDLLAMISAAEAVNMYGPYMLYVPTAVYTHMQGDFKSGSDRSIHERLLAVPSLLNIRPSAQLTSSNVVLVQFTRDVVDLVNGMQPTVLQWEAHGGMMLKFKVMAIMVPRIKDDYDSQSGIVHYS